MVSLCTEKYLLDFLLYLVMLRKVEYLHCEADRCQGLPVTAIEWGITTRGYD